MSLLAIEKLNLHFDTKYGPVHALRDVSFNLNAGEILGIVGESGSGKSITNLAIMNLLPQNAHFNATKMNYQETDLLKISEEKYQKIRGKKIAMIFQDAMSSLNPVLTVKYQIEEVLKIHTGLNKPEREKKVLDLLYSVGIPDPEKRLNSYAFELSGGMAQRVMIAMNIAAGPDILIADEPTTALDVTIQKQILDLLKSLCKTHKMAIMLITHDLGVVAQYADRIQVMYAGEIVEEQKTTELLATPLHPYTKALIESLPESSPTFKSQLHTIRGIVPSLSNRPSGCQFANRCEFMKEDCKKTISLETNLSKSVRCLFPLGEF